MSEHQEFHYNGSPQEPLKNNKKILIGVAVLITAAMILLIVAAWNAVSYFALKGSLGVAEVEIAAEADIVEEVDEASMEANEILSKYIETFRNSKLEEYLKKDSSAINYFDEDYFAPLYHGIYYENMEAITILLKYGADINLADTDSDYGSPLEFAMRCSNLEAFQFLIEEGAEIESRNSYGMTPFIYAGGKEDEEYLDLLYEAGAKIDEKDYYDWNALHHAASYGQRDNYKKLVEWGVPEELVSIEGYNMAHVSLFNGDVEYTEFLMNRGFELTQPTANGDFLIHLASSDESFLYILDNYEYDFNSKDSEGNTFLHYVRSGGLSYDLIEKTLEDGADPNIRNNKGVTPFMYATRDMVLLKLLMDHGGDKTIKDVDGDTAYDYLMNYYDYYGDEYDLEIAELLK